MSRFTRCLLLASIPLVLSGVGCAITDYPIITDARGDYQGIIRTGHPAYIRPDTWGYFVSVYPDGSDQMFSMVMQNQYGDQHLYTYNNFDPTASVLSLDQTYCDWRYEGCAVIESWNPRQNDDEFDYELFTDCSGFRTVDLLISMASRIGECGDALFGDRGQALAQVFADLDRTTWRGRPAYVAPFHAGNLRVQLVDATGRSTLVPVFGQHEALVTEDLEVIMPMRPNMRHQFNWLRAWVADHGQRATLRFDYQGFTGSVEVAFVPEGLEHSAGRL